MPRRQSGPLPVGAFHRVPPGSHYRDRKPQATGHLPRIKQVGLTASRYPMNPATRAQAIAIDAAICAVRDLANCKDPLESRATRAIEQAVSKARCLVEVIERKLAAASDATGKQK